MFANDIALTVIVFTLTIFILILGVVLTMFVANRRHVQQEIRIAQMELSYEKELRMVESEVQEAVLTNVARELHDNIGQLLTLMRIQIEQEKLDNEATANILAPVDETLTETIQQVRLLSRSLNADFLERGGLLNAMEIEITRLKAIKNTVIHWQHDDIEPLLTRDQKVMTFRIFQETINNALKHSRAKNIHVALHSRQPFRLTLSDDGVGFNVNEKINAPQSSGLKNMQRRAELAELKYTITSWPEKGSEIMLEPLGS